MRPHTPHAVVTPEHSICFGGHFYASSVLKETCIGILQAFVGSSTLTNSDSRNSWKLLHRIALYYHHVLVEKSGDAGKYKLFSVSPVDLFLVDEDKSHVPSVMEQDGMIGLLLFCIIMEISHVLHPGTYDADNEMTKREQIMLIDARKHARYLVSWVKSSYKFQERSLQGIDDIYETMLWRVSMSLCSAMEESGISPMLMDCTPDAVAGACYDTLLSYKDSKYWDQRKTYISDSYDWDDLLLITSRDDILPLEEVVTGFTECDVHKMDELPLPSINDDVTMSFWLQREVD
jgi:hypothetical protein